MGVYLAVNVTAFVEGRGSAHVAVCSAFQPECMQPKE